MALHDVLATTNKQLVFLFELELTNRIETRTWTQAASPNTNCYYCTHGPTGYSSSFEGQPSRVRQCNLTTHAISTYAPETSLVNCQAAASSRFYDSSTGYLYVHTSGGDSPSVGNYYVSSHFWIYFCDQQHTAPNEIFFNNVFYQPRLNEAAIPDATLAITPFSTGGLTQTWGQIQISNPSETVGGVGPYDGSLTAYIWQNCQFYLKCGNLGDIYANYVSLYRGLTGDITWDDQFITIEAEDSSTQENL